MEPVNHIEFEVANRSGPFLEAPRRVIVNGQAIYNLKELQIEQVPEATLGTCVVTLKFEAVTNLWEKQQEPRAVKEVNTDLSSAEVYEKLRPSGQPMRRIRQG